MSDREEVEVKPVANVRASAKQATSARVKRERCAWTPEEEHLMLMLLEQLKWKRGSYERVAKRLGRTRRAVITHVYLLGSNPSALHHPKVSRRWTDDEKNLLIQLVDAGLSYEEMTQHLHRSVASISQMHGLMTHA